MEAADDGAVVERRQRRTEMEMEMVRETLRQFMEERKLNRANGGMENDAEGEEDVLLSRLLSKLDSVKPAPESNDSTIAIPVNKHESGSNPTTTENKTEEGTELNQIAKELKVIKRQNCITHKLLSALIVVTMIWQFGEVSVILAVKEKVTHPMRSIGDLIKGAFTRKGTKSLLETPSSLEAPPLLAGPQLSSESFPLLTSK